MKRKLLDHFLRKIHCPCRKGRSANALAVFSSSRSRSLGMLAVAVGLCLIEVRSAEAQQPIGRTMALPTAPTLSPYLDLLRRDSGVLPNFQQFVRPQLRLTQRLQAQSQSIQRQQQAINLVNRRVNTLQQTPQQATTGVQTGFLQYSTFYQFPNFNIR